MSTYQDINTSFTGNTYNSTVDLKDLDSIRKGLERLFTVGKGEVPFNRNYGTTLKSLLFENDLDPSDVRMFLYMDITTFEPRVTLNPADIDIEKLDNNTYRISCVFRVPGLNNVSSVARSVLTR